MTTVGSAWNRFADVLRLIVTCRAKHFLLQKPDEAAHELSDFFGSEAEVCWSPRTG
jgi:hypothetical protein